jgi:spermidine synthase
MVGATMSEYDGVRYLHLDSIWVQGAMRIAKPQALELEYIQRMMAWMLWRPVAKVTQGHAVQLGLGAGAITRFSHKVLRMQTTAVEINPTVISACRLWFRLSDDDARLRVLNQDALSWVMDPAHRHSAQVINVDLYDHDAAAPVLDSLPFYNHCRRLLTPEGSMMVNLFGRASSFDRSVEKMAAAFGKEAIWSFKATREGNTVVLAQHTPSRPKRELLMARANLIEANWGLPAAKWVRVFKPLVP